MQEKLVENWENGVSEVSILCINKCKRIPSQSRDKIDDILNKIYIG